VISGTTVCDVRRVTALEPQKLKNVDIYNRLKEGEKKRPAKCGGERTMKLYQNPAYLPRRARSRIHMEKGIERK